MRPTPFGYISGFYLTGVVYEYSIFNDTFGQITVARGDMLTKVYINGIRRMPKIEGYRCVITGTITSSSLWADQIIIYDKSAGEYVLKEYHPNDFVKGDELDGERLAEIKRAKEEIQKRSVDAPLREDCADRLLSPDGETLQAEDRGSEGGDSSAT